MLYFFRRLRKFVWKISRKHGTVVPKRRLETEKTTEIIKKAGSWFSYDDTKLGQGRDAVKTLLLDNPELMEELEKKIKDSIAALNE